MIIVLYITLIAISFLFKVTKTKNQLDINNLFTLLWGAVGIISYLNFLPLIRVEEYIHYNIILSIFLFNIVYLIFRKKDTILYKNKIEITNNKKFELNFKFIYILNILAFCIMLPLFFEAIILIMNNGFSNYRHIIKEAAMQNNFSALINRQLTKAIFDITTLIAVIQLTKGDKRLIALSLAGILVYTITYGGRYALLNFVIYYICAYILTGKKIEKIKGKYIFFIIVAMTFTTIVRNSDGISLIESALIYFVGSLSFLQYILNNPLSFGWGDGLTYGYLTFGFITEPLAMAIKVVTGWDINMPSYYFNIYTQKFYNIGETENFFYNNNTTFYYHFLRDFGKFGFVLGTIFFASVTSLLVNKFNRTFDFRILCFLVYLCGVLLTSTMMYTMLNITTFISFVLILIFTKKTKNSL